MSSQHYLTFFKITTRSNALRDYSKRFMCSAVGRLTLQDMPTPRGLPLLGSAPAVFVAALNCRIHKYVHEKHNELGSIFRDKLGPVDTVLISDPNLMRSVFTKHEGKYPQHIVPDSWTLYNDKFNVKRGLFFMDGEEWLETRRIMNKLLLKPSTDTWIEEPLSQVTDNFVTFWQKQSTVSGYEPDLDKELHKLSLEVILSIMLGSVYLTYHQRFEELVQQFANSVHGIFSYSSKMYMMPGHFYEKFKLPSWRGFERCVTESLAHGEQLVNELYKLENIGDGLSARMIKEGMSRQLVTRILIDLIIAAGDTTSYTTQWALHLLSQNPDVIENFSKTTPCSEEERLNIKCISKETMRLYPVASFITRILDSDAYIAGYSVPAKTILVMSLYTSGRNQIYFPEPLIFKPERWNKNISQMSKDVNTPHASIPFAMGARSCIGRKIAMGQMHHFITKVLRNFQLRSLNEDNVEDIMQMVLKPAQKIRILIEPKCDVHN